MKGTGQIWLLLSFLILVSCGRLTSKTSKTKSISPYRRQSIHPIIIKKQYDQCPRIYRQSQNTKFQIKQYLNGEYLLRALNLKGFLQGQRIQSYGALKAINSATAEFESEKEYAMNFDSSSGQWLPTNLIFNNNIINPGSDVQLCPGNRIYQQMTVESAAISIAHTITKTKSRVKSLLPEQDISPISIRVTPLLGKKYIGHHAGKEHHLKLYDTDNAFYRPSDRTIQFLPQSKEGLEQNIFGSIPLWEIPMVASHEYGHHLFTELYSRYINLYYAHEHETEYCFHSGRENKMSKEQQVTRSLGKRSVNYLLFIRSVNEAFADLVSFYALDDTERGLKNISCMQINRETDRSFYQDGSKKIYNKQVYDQFTSPIKLSDDGSCSTPNFQHIHTVGAIFAHATDQLLSLLTSSKGDKLTIVLNWAMALNENHYQLKNVSKNQLYEVLFSLMGKVALDHIPTIDEKKFCQTVKTYYPRTKFNHSDNFIPNCQ